MIYERRIRFTENPGYLGKDLYIYQELADGKIEVEYQDAEKGVATRKVFDRGQAIAPVLRLGDEDLQALADELQRLNIRPREASKTEGLLEAQTAHLDDLRHLLGLDEVTINGVSDAELDAALKETGV